jgi:hypothetical protein
MVYVSRKGKRKDACRVLVGNLRERNHLKHLDIDGSIILKQTFKKLDGADMDGINLAQDRGRRQALVIAVINYRVP